MLQVRYIWRGDVRENGKIALRIFWTDPLEPTISELSNVNKKGTEILRRYNRGSVFHFHHWCVSF